MTIIDVLRQKGHLYKIVLSDETSFLVDKDVCESIPLIKGKELSKEEITEILKVSDYERAKSRALWFLDRGDRTEKGLYEKIVAGGISPESAAKAVARFKELGLIDDCRFARNFAERCLSSNISKRQTYVKLLTKGVPKDIINNETLNNELKWIRTSFGISVIIILKSTNQIIMTHRSKNASFSQGKNWIYVSVTEALSQADVDEYDSAVDFSLCVKRGIKEELGIEKGMYHHDDIKFYDCFFETQFFQDGIVASVELSEKIMPQDIINFRAKDKRLEIEDIFFIDNNKAAIQKFINDNHNEMRSQTIFALESYLESL